MAAILCVSGLFAQQAKVVSAFNYLRNGQLDKAKLNIDEASKNDATKGLAKTWFYRGNIYLNIHLTTNNKYKGLDTNALQVAYDSYQAAIAIDPNISNENLAPTSPMLGLFVIGEQYYNKGVELYNVKNYTEAMTNFEMTKKINTIFQIKDTTATFNIALCALNLKDNKKAKSCFEELMKNNYKQSIVYTSLSGIYKNEGDTVKALGVIEKGRKIFPQDLNLIIAQINIYLAQGKTKEANDLLAVAVNKDPNNPALHFAIGANMDEVGNFAEAEKSYKKAIELKPDYFDAYYNLGALYVNSAASKMEEANKLPLGDAKYDELKAVADKLLTDAIPVLETAERLQPTDKNTLLTLKQLYARKSDAENLKRVEEKLSKLK